VTADAQADIDFLERRRRLALRSAAIALLVALVSFPLGMAIGGSETAETIAGAFLLAGIIGLVAAPWIVRAWQGFMQRRMVAAAVANRPDIRHIDSEHDRRASEEALSSAAFSLGAFHDSGLVEAFDTATVQHVLTGDAQGVPFAIAEVALLDAKAYRMFGGVLASFRLARPRTGLTIVARDHGLLGNLLARAGSGIERLPLEDPDFEGVFEVYGDDQVGGRVILTTTMLERLKALDELAHARGFACAFRGEHLLIAFSGMSWRCPAWRIVRPIDAWLHTYAEWLTGLVELPRDIVKTLDLVACSADVAVPFVPEAIPGVAIDAGPAQVFSSGLWRLVGEGGMPLVYVASGAIFGGVALIGAWYGMTEGYSKNLFWYFWGMIAAGVIYGAYAIALGVRQLAQLAWRWNAPLRTLNRP
jgi:Protein of unknown function (DUF3137)